MSPAAFIGPCSVACSGSLHGTEDVVGGRGETLRGNKPCLAELEKSDKKAIAC